MNAKYWAGFISVNTILQHKNIATWAVHWLRRAEQAEKKGKELVIFEIPVNDRLHALEAIEGTLQHEYDLLQVSVDPGTENHLNSLFIQAIMMPPDGVQP